MQDHGARVRLNLVHGDIEDHDEHVSLARAEGRKFGVVESVVVHGDHTHVFVKGRKA